MRVTMCAHMCVGGISSQLIIKLIKNIDQSLKIISGSNLITISLLSEELH